jgi:hypothetical protein
MGESAAQTVREIEETRTQLDTDLRELERRLPAPVTWGKRIAGLAVGGGIGGTMFWFGAKRLRKRRKDKAAQERAPQAIVQVIPSQWAEKVGSALEGGEWKGWLLLAGAGWLVLRLAEIRQLGRMNRMFLTGSRAGTPTA